MKVVTASEMQDIDNSTIENWGIPAEALMFNAGCAVVKEIIAHYSSLKKVAVVIGTGHNGGDGFVIAYLLKNEKISVDIFFNGPSSKLDSITTRYYELCQKKKIKFCSFTQPQFEEYDLIVDSLLGIGFIPPLRDDVASLIQIINNSQVPVVAVDIPSGLPASGQIEENELSIIQADLTITMGLPKLSLVNWPGKKYCGCVIVADIGFPVELLEKKSQKNNLLDLTFIKKLKSVSFAKDIHKYQKGNLLVLGGFPGMEGAGLMVATAALNIGCGLVTIATLPESRKIIAGQVPEIMTYALPVEKNIRDDDWQKFKEFCWTRKFTTLEIGSGLGRSEISKNLSFLCFRDLNELPFEKIVIDGDGLFWFAEFLTKNKFNCSKQIIITPHEGEAARLLHVEREQIHLDRICALQMLQKKTGSIVVLKGPATLVIINEEIYINNTGNNLLATAGTGDILAGTIAGVLSQENYQNALLKAVYFHSYAADLLKKRNKLNVLKATDLLFFIKTEFFKESEESNFE